MKLLGLIGYPLEHSFSANYFAKKFEKEKITDVEYRNFPLQNIDRMVSLIAEHQDLQGLNVTIPHKETVVPYLNQLHGAAKEIRAVNTIRIVRNGKNTELHGYNTDTYGFEAMILPYLQPHHRHAIILGTGGASKAVAYVLRQKRIMYRFVSRNIEKNFYSLSYKHLTNSLIENHEVLVNTTPVGMYLDKDIFPPIPYNVLSEKHLVVDLIYNPAETSFMQKAREQGATALNGLKMLEEQAAKAWEVWNLKPEGT